MTQEEPNFGDVKPLVATGLSSAIRDDGVSSRRHVLAIDWDDWTPGEREEGLLDDLPGVSIMLESSDGSKHVWNLTMRSLDQTALELLKFKSDPTRTMLGYRWRPPRWITRVGPKVFRPPECDPEDLSDELREAFSKFEGLEYKHAPEFVAAQVNATSRPQSAMHYDTLAEYVHGLPPRDAVPDVVPWERSDVRVEKYRCMTDAQKGEANE